MSLFVEPSLGYSPGTFEHQGTENKSDGFGLSSKVGMNILGLTGGLQLSFTSHSVDGPNDNNWEQRQYGIFLGVDFGKDLPLKTWFTFYPYTELDQNSSQELFGSGLAFGLGYYPWIIAPISFSMEYRQNTFDEVQNAVGRTSLSQESKLSVLYFGVNFYFSTNQ